MLDPFLGVTFPHSGLPSRIMKSYLYASMRANFHIRMWKNCMLPSHWKFLLLQNLESILHWIVSDLN